MLKDILCKFECGFSYLEAVQVVRGGILKLYTTCVNHYQIFRLLRFQRKIRITENKVPI